MIDLQYLRATEIKIHDVIEAVRKPDNVIKYH
jgi:hypothetical protein